MRHGPVDGILVAAQNPKQGPLATGETMPNASHGMCTKTRAEGHVKRKQFLKRVIWRGSCNMYNLWTLGI